MSSIKEIKFQGNGHVILKLDDGRKLKTSEDTFFELGISHETPINENFLQRLESFNDTAACRKKMYDLLARRPHGKKELLRKLDRGQKFDPKLVYKLVCEAEERGYINDRDYCRLFIEDSMNLKPGDGPGKIRQQLMRRGVQKQLIDESLHELARDPQDELNTVLVIAQKKWDLYPERVEFQKKKARLYRFLASRGFSSQVISQVIKKVAVFPRSY
ncbi:MAG: regulatory protein RecX [Lentisphaeraceae bacterium]|nr:regulatory protein RecX [Lentisphaeraceae bacterium]